MGFGQLVLVAVNGISALLSNPLLSGGATVKAKHASELLTILGAFVQKGTAAHDELEVFAGVIKAMADGGRGPTKVEREFLRDQRALTHEGYQAERARILGGQEELEPTLTEEQREVAELEVKLVEDGLTDQERARLDELRNLSTE